MHRIDISWDNDMRRVTEEFNGTTNHICAGKTKAHHAFVRSVCRTLDKKGYKKTKHSDGIVYEKE